MSDTCRAALLWVKFHDSLRHFHDSDTTRVRRRTESHGADGGQAAYVLPLLLVGQGARRDLAGGGEGWCRAGQLGLACWDGATDHVRERSQMVT